MMDLMEILTLATTVVTVASAPKEEIIDG